MVMLLMLMFTYLRFSNPDTNRGGICLGGSYAKNSTFERNLNSALSSLSYTGMSVTNKSSVGSNPDQVYVSYMCRGDITSESCMGCVNGATQKIKQNCPSSKAAIVWYNLLCTLRYSNESFYYIYQRDLRFRFFNEENSTNPYLFNQTLADLMSKLVREATLGSNLFKFAKGKTRHASFGDIYGLVQCDAISDRSDCDKCFRWAITELPSCCYGRVGAQIIGPNCYLRYEVYPFFENPKKATTTPASPTPLSSLATLGKEDKHREKNKKTRIYLGVILAVAFALVIAVVSFICLARRKATREKAYRKNVQASMFQLEDSATDRSSLYKHNDVQSAGVDVPFVEFETILAATENFSDSNKLGEGGFGPVYKGNFGGGLQLAVKRLSTSSGQGLEEFKTEVLLIAKLQHRNLVRLLGYCIKGDDKMLLYEYMPNNSLDTMIFDRSLCLSMSWETRLNIILGIARGVLYLHQDSRLRIIHRDLKTSNILLDEEMIPKISDFGTARIFGGIQTQENTNKVVGTYGYMAPEYALDGVFSVKSDVYSFGVVLLEIISGKKNAGSYISEEFLSLVGCAWRLWSENRALDFIDSSLSEACNSSEVLKCIHVGLLCLQEDANDRPTMSSVVVMLGGEALNLPTPKEPAFIFKKYLSSTTSTSTRVESFQ